MTKRHWMGLAGLALLAACAGAKAPPPAAEAAPKPALWKLSDADTTLYLFGTVHVLPKDFKWRTAAFDSAAASADSLVLEVADGADATKMAATFTELAMSPGLPPVEERVPADKRAGLDKLIAKAGIPEAALDNFESWAVAITLASGMLGELGFSPEYGVEPQLTAEFKTRGKPVTGLETSAQQLGFFDSLPEPAQRAFLVSMVDESSDAKGEFDRMTKAWASGDTKAIALTFDDEVRMTPELTEVLLVRRNANWTEWLAKRLDQPGTVLVAVGAGHLAGDDSVIAMLEKRGLKAVRVQ